MASHYSKQPNPSPSHKSCYLEGNKPDQNCEQCLAKAHPGNVFNPERKLHVKIQIPNLDLLSLSLPISQLGKDPGTKSDEFLENFQMAFDPPLIFSFLEN